MSGGRDQQPPGPYEQEQSQEIQGKDHPSLVVAW